jgi:hypothetical protein
MEPDVRIRHLDVKRRVRHTRRTRIVEARGLSTRLGGVSRAQQRRPPGDVDRELGGIDFARQIVGGVAAVGVDGESTVAGARPDARRGNGRVHLAREAAPVGLARDRAEDRRPSFLANGDLGAGTFRGYVAVRGLTRHDRVPTRRNEETKPAVRTGAAHPTAHVQVVSLQRPSWPAGHDLRIGPVDLEHAVVGARRQRRERLAVCIRTQGHRGRQSGARLTQPPIHLDAQRSPGGCTAIAARFHALGGDPPADPEVVPAVQDSIRTSLPLRSSRPAAPESSTDDGTKAHAHVHLSSVALLPPYRRPSGRPVFAAHPAMALIGSDSIRGQGAGEQRASQRHLGRTRARVLARDLRAACVTLEEPHRRPLRPPSPVCLDRKVLAQEDQQVLANDHPARTHWRLDRDLGLIPPSCLSPPWSPAPSALMRGGGSMISASGDGPRANALSQRWRFAETHRAQLSRIQDGTAFASADAHSAL